MAAGRPANDPGGSGDDQGPSDGGPLFARLFLALREAKVPVSLTEYLSLIGAVRAGVGGRTIDDFYLLARMALVKDERHLDRFDLVFGQVYRGLGAPAGQDEQVGVVDLPEEWLRTLGETLLTEEEKAEIEAIGGWDALMDALRQRLSEQQGRHEGGSKWIGTAGTSPFGAYGYNPQGVRIGQAGGRHNRAVKVWDRRDFKDYDDTRDLGTRTIKVALRGLRRFARTGRADQLDLPGTIGATARNGGYLDLKMQPERHNAVQVLLLLDVGGSMDPHVRQVEELFSAARGEFKHLEVFYFHNCPYERLWRSARRRPADTVDTRAVINTYGSSYRLILVGDAAMSPYELTVPGGSVEHWNDTPGQAWLQALLDHYSRAVWLNPLPEAHWGYHASARLIGEVLQGRMHALTLAGLDGAIRDLG